MEPYQEEGVTTFLGRLPNRHLQILELGSDIHGEVASFVANRKSGTVIGVNPAANFPTLPDPSAVPANLVFSRADGRSLPFGQEAFDAVLSIATLEHVQELDKILSEASRVLKTGGFFYATFGPIWSCARGHHVFAIVGAKEARFWKPGRNPIPDYFHLLKTPEEMREYLAGGPTSPELIEPIIEWIYRGDGINRLFLEDYLRAFSEASLVVQKIELHPEGAPSPAVNEELKKKYGIDRNFSCSRVSVVLRKIPESAGIEGTILKSRLVGQRFLYRVKDAIAGQVIMRAPEVWKMYTRLRDR